MIKVIGVFSAGIWRIPHLQNFLPSQCCKLSFLKPLPVEIEAIAVWGNRPSAQKPETVARKADIPVVRLEDGFIRSLGLGVTGSPPLSMVIDYQGIYYDARVPSTLESLIKDTQGNAVYIQQANLAISTIIEHDLSKYNQSVPFEPAISKQEKIVLVVDQTKGDVSVKFGNATEDDFQRMLSAALDENPDDAIWLKVHPDVLSGKKKGYYNTGDIHPRVRLFTGDVSPHSLFKYVKRVYAVTSHYGFEALVSGVPVVCFGQPWYSGWGLTDDRHPQAMQLAVRRGTATLVELFTSAYLRYSRYIHPQTGKPGTLFDVLSWLICQRTFIRQRAGLLWAPGLTLWKSTIVKPFLSTDKNQVSFLFRKRAASACVVWGVKGEQRWGGKATAHALPVWRLEDGFLRSSGLGSDLLPPLSLVLDKRGIYYDATRPSDLEVLLQESTLDETQRIRATRLQAFLVSNKISKYNLGDTWKLPACAASKRVILVPGQVEDDASIATGTVSINTNYDLLRLVRERNPDAFIIYKPHPDVLVGNRKGAISEHDTTRLADMQALDADIIQCIQQADELHTLTSLSGFEALMHGKKVFCYGLPFYAGWGLTIDEHRSVRRTRALTMEELVYQALIAYPTYVHPQLLQPTEVEQIGQWLSQAPRTEMKINTTRFSRVLRQFRKFKNLYRIKFG